MSRPIIGILRGIKPEEAVAVCSTLIEAGITEIEVPLNSPNPFDSIERMLKAYGSHANIGAGTVLTTDDVKQLAHIGGKMVVSPNCNTSVIQATKALGMKSYPGVFTPTECFTALDAGADGLKLFPSFVLGSNGLAALSAVLPASTDIYAVGGVGCNNFSEWLNAGATGFGIGSALYHPGMAIDDIAKAATTLVAAFDEAHRRHQQRP